jgi:molybdate transport system ATP-binding protein
MLTVSVRKRLGEFQLRVAFAGVGRVIALFGPSGAGKTSIINMIAGLVRPDEGRIVLGDTVLFDSAARVDVAASRRNIGYVFQDGRLFPHLSVGHNLGYGRWIKGLPFDAQAHARVVDMLDIAPLIHRRPGKLSGGERQRVAIGRALLARPRLLLLDEPLASLDPPRKAEILPYLERLRDEAGVPMVYVSHQPDEARRLATAVVRIEDGAVKAVGGPELLG